MNCISDNSMAEPGGISICEGGVGMPVTDHRGG